MLYNIYMVSQKSPTHIDEPSRASETVDPVLKLIHARTAINGIDNASRNAVRMLLESGMTPAAAKGAIVYVNRSLKAPEAKLTAALNLVDELLGEESLEMADEAVA
jgi:hypothetical protein